MAKPTGHARDIGVHASHCCVLHHCKYGEWEDCPVMTRQVKQLYLCEDCPQDGIESLEQLEGILAGTIPVCPHCQHVLRPDDPRPTFGIERRDPEGDDDAQAPGS